jgi:hypothetical protein
MSCNVNQPMSVGSQVPRANSHKEIKWIRHKKSTYPGWEMRLTHY